MSYDKIKNLTGFDWDEGNISKSWIKHDVSPFECEQVFFNQPLIVKNDEKHSKKEIRYYGLGKTDYEKKLFVVFTIRENKIRIISARIMSKKEREIYEK